MFFTSISAANTQKALFGNRSLQIPAPAGFIALSAVEPATFNAAQAYLPADNRLIEMYQPQSGEIIDADGIRTTYFQLQTLRQVDGVVIAAEEFSSRSQQTEEELKTAFSTIDDVAEGLLKKGNQSAKEQTGVDPEVALGKTAYRGVFRKEPWGLFYSTQFAISAGGGETINNVPMVMSGALALVDHQILLLYAYRRFDDPKDEAWTQNAVNRWADSMRAANPDDPAVAASARRSGFDWGRLGISAILGGVVAGLISLFAVFTSKARKR